MKEWFNDWFNSPWYHLLYDARDDAEAEGFIMRLVEHFGISKGTVLDAPCGNGRHSKVLATHGYRVTGVDIAPKNIELAKQRNLAEANFFVGDLRQMQYDTQFNIALNLFTSFGYFENEHDNQTVLQNFYKALVTEGHLIIDFFNVTRVLNEMVCSTEIVKQNVRFKIRKEVKDNRIIKTIDVFEGTEAKGQFTERVQLLNEAYFRKHLTIAGFTLKNLFGDYKMQPYNEITSPRLIVEAVKC